MTPRPLLALPGYVVNGIAVAVGIGVLQVLLAATLGPTHGALAIGGALCASLSDQPNTVARTWRRLLLAVALSVAAAAVVVALRPHPILLGGGIAAIGFVALMTMAWGTRAGTVSFAPILAIIFTMAVPRQAALALPGWLLPLLTAAGGLGFLAWSMLAGAALQPAYRRSAMRGAMVATAGLFRSRARVLGDLLGAPVAEAAQVQSLRAWIQGEALLGERLQAARDLVFAAPESARGQRDTLLLMRLVDLRDGLIASRLDLDLLGHDDAGRWVLQHVATALDDIARLLDGVVEGMKRASPLPMPPAPPSYADQFAEAPLAAGDARRRLLPAVAGRLQRLSDDAMRMHAILHGQVAGEPMPLTHAQLQHFVAAEGWPLRALRSQFTWRSPVLRHAVRTGLALATAYGIGAVLPWASHPHWLVLSLAVVLRGNLEQTISRRNARVGGTVLGCILVMALARVQSPPLLAGAFLLAIATAHAFVLRRYWLAAAAASVMALLQSYMVHPAGGFAVAERLADTFLGAGLAWAFSYVLPSWERTHVPQAIQRLLAELRDYASHALVAGPGDAMPQRLARRRAYDALTAVAAALERTRAEPRGVRLPAREVAMLVDHAQRLLAHLSVVRLMLSGQRVDPADPEAARALLSGGQALAACLDLEAPAPGVRPPRDALELSSLPPAAPAEDLRPWLLRRLLVLEQEAHDIRRASLGVIGALRR